MARKRDATLAESAVLIDPEDGVMYPFLWHMADEAEWSDDEDPVLKVRVVFPYRPLIESPALFLDFVALDGTPESFADFALEYGPLFGLWDPEKLSAWQDEHTRLSEAVALLEDLQAGRVRDNRDYVQRKLGSAITQGLSDHHVTPTVRPSGVIYGAGMQLAFRVISLIGGMWLQLAVAADGERKYLPCEVCGKRMDITDAPSHKRVCGPNCRAKRAYLKKTGQWEGGEDNDETSER